MESGYSFGKGDWITFEQGIEREWLVTNGLGGYASSSIICANTRKYHGLLVASLEPPVHRTLFLAKLDERYETGGHTYNLASNITAGGLTEFGHIHLQRVLVDSIPTFTYSFADVFIHKTIFMPYEKNTTVVIYRIKNGGSPAVLRLVPLVNCRNYHWTTRQGQLSFDVRTGISHGYAAVTIGCLPGTPPLELACGDCAFSAREEWFSGMFYPREKERGEHAYEDHFMPGWFTVALAAGEEKTFAFTATLEKRGEANPGEGEDLLTAERDRKEGLLKQAVYRDHLADRLVRAADSFIVSRKSTGKKSVIAGYHWFNDWGRDAMIALPGLTMATGRYGDAREILSTFASYCRDGLIPNMFADPPRDPLYNTVDASLWFFYAAYKYLQYTDDRDFIMEGIYPALKEIANNYINGTRFDIKMDDDGLIMAGSAEMQLTWMDAKVDHWVVTPRHGKPVEISALWYNALKFLEDLAAIAGETMPCGNLSGMVGRAFMEKFWHDGGGCFYDVISDAGSDARMRPNQIIALALPYSPVPLNKARQVVNRVWRELYATYGLRSLSYYDPGYCGVYDGDRVKRDGAYHQGTAWSWLAGLFITSYRRACGYSPESRRQAALFINPFRDHLANHGVGYISEIFDGNEPTVPRGCIAQAWGVAEILRSYVEDVLEAGPGAGKLPLGGSE